MSELYEVVIIGKNIKTAAEATPVSEFGDDWWGALRRADELSYQLKCETGVRKEKSLLQGFRDGCPFQPDPRLNLSDEEPKQAESENGLSF